MPFYWLDTWEDHELGTKFVGEVAISAARRTHVTPKAIAKQDQNKQQH